MMLADGVLGIAPLLLRFQFQALFHCFDIAPAPSAAPWLQPCPLGPPAGLCSCSNARYRLAAGHSALDAAQCSCRLPWTWTTPAFWWPGAAAWAWT